MKHDSSRPFRLGPSILALSLATGLLAAPAAAQSGTGETPVIGPIVGRAIKHDVSRPLREIARDERPYPPGFEVEVPMGEVERRRPVPPRIEDPLRQTEARPFAEAALTPAPSINFEGVAFTGFVPPDTVGDVGVDHYVQWVNVSFAVFDKATGTIVGGGPSSGNSLWAGFGAPCETTNNGDPIVLYDHLAGRWLLSQFAINQGTQCVALSQTGDPLGTYDRWAFVVSPGQQNDYPKIGVMPDAYYLSVRDFPPGTSNFAGFIALDRAAMLAGDPAAGFIKFGLPCDTDNNNCPDYVQPPHLEGPPPTAGTPGFFTKVWDDDFEGPWSGAGGADGYRIWRFVPDFADPDSSTFSELPLVASSADFSTDMCGGARRCIKQPLTGASSGCISTGLFCPDLDAIADGQMYRAQYRHFAGSHDSLVLTNTVDATGSDIAGSRWVELRNPDPAGADAWTLFQDGTYAPADGVNRWMGSAAMDQAGNIALGYSVTRRSPEVFPGVRYTSREAGDPPGTMPGGEVELIAGGAIQTSFSNRWGDYSSMSVDPTDDCTFWYTQEYIGAGSSNWRTRIGAFKLDSCSNASIAGAPDSLGFGAIQVAMSSTPQTVTITNDGSDDYNVTGLTLSNATDFFLDPSPAGDPCGAPPLPLAAGTDCDVAMTFTPQSQAVFAETLTVATDAGGVEAVIDVEGTGFTPCADPTDHETLTGTASGTITVSTCRTVTLDGYDFTGGTLTVVTGETISLLEGTSLAGTVSLEIDPFKALP